MSLASQVEREFQRLLMEHKTQTAVGEKLGVSKQIINSIFTGHTNIANITLGVINRMFPNATINLNGDETPRELTEDELRKEQELDEFICILERRRKSHIEAMKNKQNPPSEPQDG